MIVLAIIGVGGIFTGTNPSYTEAELSHHIKTAGATFLLSEPEISSPLIDAAKKNGISEDNLWIFDKLEQQVPPGKRSWKSLLDHGEDDWVRFSDIKLAQSTTAARLFSSGTTGLPKAVTITHYNLIAQHELAFKADPRPYQVCAFLYCIKGIPYSKQRLILFALDHVRYREWFQYRYSTLRQPLQLTLELLHLVMLYT